jgi:hypothetical protein
MDWTEYVLNVGSDMLKKCLPKYHMKDLDVGGNLILKLDGISTDWCIDNLGHVGPHLIEQNPTIHNHQVLNLDSPRNRYSSCTAPEPVSVRSNVLSFSNFFLAFQMTASRLFRRYLTP